MFCVPPKIHVKTLTPKMTAFVNTAFMKIIKIKGGQKGTA